MPSPQKLYTHRLMFSEMLLAQAKPYLTGKPDVWAKEFGEVATFGSTLGKVAKAKFLPFAKTTMPTDCRVFHHLPTKLGDAYAVLHFRIFAVQPTDYIFILNCNIPRAAFVKKAKKMELTDKWATDLTEKGGDDPFATYLTNLERKKGVLPESPHTYAHWTYPAGKLSVEVPYTMALIPLGDGRTVFLFKRYYSPGFFSLKKSNFDLELIWRIANWIDEALGEFNYEGGPAPLEVPVAAASLLAIPEIAPVFEYQGRDIPFNVNLSAYEQVNKAKVDQQPVVEEPEGQKFCIQCGTALPEKAAFCSKCGTKQS